LAEELRQVFGAEAKLIPGKDGIFDVIIDGKLVFAKSGTGRFPNPGEVVSKLKQ